MAGWHDCIDAMTRIADWWRTQDGIQYGNLFIRSVFEAESEFVGNYDQLKSGWLANTARTQLLYAEPIFVTHEVMDLIDHASESFKPEPLQATDILTPSGFVLLPRPFYVRERSGRRVGTRAFSWGPAASSDGKVGIYLNVYSDPSDPNDDYHDELRLLSPPSVYLLWHISPWWYGQNIPKIEELLEYKPEHNDVIGSPAMWVWLQTFFRMSMQQVVTPQYMHLPRPWSRRAKRAGRDPGVFVATLRRPRQRSEGEGNGYTMTVRSITRGHWRNQWYPSLKQHRQIWINMFVRGPEDAPLKTPALRAWDFRR